MKYPDGTARTRHTTVNGRSQGRFAEYYQSGVVRVRGTYVDDRGHGVWEYFDQQGHPHKREVHWHGQVVWTSPSANAEVPAAWTQRLAEESQRIYVTGSQPPSYATADRIDSTDHMAAQIGYHRIVEDPQPPTAGARLALYGQRRLAGPWVAYGELTMGGIHESSSDLGGRGVPVAELGVAHASPPRMWGVSRQNFGWVARASLFGPLAPADDDQAAVTANLSYERVSDLALALPHVAGVRAAGSAYGQAERLVWRVDFGIDNAFDLSGDDDTVSIGASMVQVARGTVVAGIDLDDAVFAAELSAAAMLQDEVLAERSARTLAISGVTNGQTWRPRLAIVSPLHEDRFGRHFAVIVAVDYLQR